MSGSRGSMPRARPTAGVAPRQPVATPKQPGRSGVLGTVRSLSLVAAGVLALACASLGVAAPSAPAASLEQVGGYDDPLYVTSDPANPDRLFVVERAGRIQLTTPAGTSQFLDITGRVADGYVEQGLLSMALAPDFATSGRFYVYYTGTDSGAIHIGEFRASGDVADPSTFRNVITIPHADAPNHNGGQVQFGPDGYLYLGTGDGGGSNDDAGAGNNAQNLGGMLGKLLRIDPRQSGPNPYTVPAGNPFAGIPGVQPEIWSYGLRNPFRFSFDRATGDLVIGDVGQGTYEEIDHVTGSDPGRGVNFGWRCREGAHPNPNLSGSEACAPPGAVDPVLEYTHAGGGCAVTGGYVVRDPGLSELAGRYLYADYCLGQLRSAILGTPLASGDRAEGIHVSGVSGFGEDACGRVYVVSRSGPVSRLVDGTPTDCTGMAPPPDPDERCARMLDGSRTDDVLRGGPGGQQINGRGGDDRLSGGDGEDCLDGGAGRDRLSGGAGADNLVGGNGADRIRADDGERDTVTCGRGQDRARADRIDRVRGCERLNRPKR